MLKHTEICTPQPQSMCLLFFECAETQETAVYNVFAIGCKRSLACLFKMFGERVPLCDSVDQKLSYSSAFALVWVRLCVCVWWTSLFKSHSRSQPNRSLRVFSMQCDFCCCCCCCWRIRVAFLATCGMILFQLRWCSTPAWPFMLSYYCCAVALLCGHIGFVHTFHAVTINIGFRHMRNRNGCNSDWIRHHFFLFFCSLLDYAFDTFILFWIKAVFGFFINIHGTFFFVLKIPTFLPFPYKLHMVRELHMILWDSKVNIHRFYSIFFQFFSTLHIIFYETESSNKIIIPQPKILNCTWNPTVFKQLCDKSWISNFETHHQPKNAINLNSAPNKNSSFSALLDILNCLFTQFIVMEKKSSKL